MIIFCRIIGIVRQVLSRLSPLPRAGSLSRGPGRRDVCVTTQLNFGEIPLHHNLPRSAGLDPTTAYLNLGEIPLLSRPASPVISAATDVDDHPLRNNPGSGGGVNSEIYQDQQQHVEPQRQRLLAQDVVDCVLPPAFSSKV